MHTGVISFCDRVGYNIKSSETKEVILEELNAMYQVQILQKHWHRLDSEGIKQMYRSPHFACLRSNGNPYYMYFTRYDDVPIIFYIDKKIQPGYQVPRIILGRGKWSEDLFHNTLIEGEMVKDKFGKWLFLINDVIGYKGDYLWRLTLPERLEYAYRILNEHYTPDSRLDVCKFYVKRYAHATQEGVDALLDMSRDLPYTSRGIYFWPFSRKFKPKLYNFDESLIKTVVRKVKDNPEFRETVQHPPSPSAAAAETATPLTADQQVTAAPAPKDAGDEVLWLRKTEHPDVYDVYASAHTSSQKEGVALVPSMTMSRLLRAEFKDTTVAVTLPFVCVYDKAKQKWLPIRKAAV